MHSKEVYNFFDLAFRSFILKTTKFFAYTFIALFCINIITSYYLLDNKLEKDINNLSKQITEKKNFLESLLNNIKSQLPNDPDHKISKVLAQSYDFFNGTYLNKNDIENLEWMQIIPYRKAINIYGVLEPSFLNKKINLCISKHMCYDLDSGNGNISFYINKINQHHEGIILITLSTAKFIAPQETYYDNLDISIDNNNYKIINHKLGKQIINKKTNLSFLNVNLGISYISFIKIVLVRQLYILVTTAILHILMSCFLWLFIHFKKKQIKDLKKRIFAHNISTKSFADYTNRLCVSNLKNSSKAKELLDEYIDHSEHNNRNTYLNQLQDIVEDISDNIFLSTSNQLCIKQLLSDAMDIFAEEILTRKVTLTRDFNKKPILVNQNIYPLIVSLIYYHFSDIPYGGTFVVQVNHNNENTNINIISDVFNSLTQNYNPQIASVNHDLLLHHSVFEKVAKKIGVTLKIKNGEQRKTTLTLNQNKEEQSKVNVVKLFE